MILLGKPCPWGIKNYVLCGKSGYPYDFIIYQGSNTELSSYDSVKYGHGAAVVLHLTKRLSLQGHTLLFDNFFSTYQLIEILKQRSINAACTIRINRFSNPQFLSDSVLKKQGRGSSDEMISKEGDIVIIKWQDNKSVYLASNYVGKGTEKTVSRFDKKQKMRITINQPEIVAHYNAGMGGVDLLDQLVAYYRIFIKSRKWLLRVIFHFVSMATVSSWIEYRNECKKNGLKPIDLLHFQINLGRYLISHSFLNTNRKRVAENNIAECSPRRTKEEVRPHCSFQFDEVGHWPAHDDKPQATRCKAKKCIGRTRVFCQKCKVHLCLTKDRNCFHNFHIK